MATLSDLPAGIVTRLQAAQQPGGSLAAAGAAAVLREDAHDLATQIAKAANQFGLVILVGMPHAENSATPQNPNLQMKVHTAIGIREDPLIWRRQNPDGSQRPFAPAVAQIVAQLVQNLKLPAFNYLTCPRLDFVPDKKVQLYEIAVETTLVVPTLTN